MMVLPKAKAMTNQLAGLAVQRLFMSWALAAFALAQAYAAPAPWRDRLPAAAASLVVTRSQSAPMRESRGVSVRPAARRYVDPPLLGGMASVPPREGAETLTTRTARTDLFARVAASSMQAFVGLKTPGTPRGIWRATRLIDSKRFLQTVETVRQLPGVTVLWTDDILPLVIVKMRDRAAFERLVRYPFIDYIEPADTHIQPQDFGCNGVPVTWPTTTGPSGDVIPQTYGPNGIERAWAREPAAGRGMIVGVVDTGLSRLQPEMMIDSFDAVGRSIVYMGCTTISCLQSMSSGAWASCDHGPRVASVVGAPRNGRSIVGVAFGADLRVSKGSNSVYTEDPLSQTFHLIAIRTVREEGARIINMAFGSLFDNGALGDEIRLEFYRTDLPEVLFVGAAGTDACPQVKPVAFPARMPEVFAVTGVNLDGSLEKTSCTGSEVRIAAFLMPFESAGMVDGEVDSLGGTSGVSAMVSGIAAMTWARYPTLSREQLIARLIGRSSLKPSQIGVPIIDAYAAVGGLRQGLILRSVGFANPDTEYTFAAQLDGEGPFSYLWNTGETSSRIQRTGPSHAEVTATDEGDGSVYHYFSDVGPPPSPDACLRTCDSDFNRCKAGADGGEAIKVCMDERSSCRDACNGVSDRGDFRLPP